MADSSADDSDDGTPPADEAEIGSAVDDALKDEIKRQRARFVQQIVGYDRVEGVGRAHERRGDDPDPFGGVDRPGDPSD